MANQSAKYNMRGVIREWYRPSQASFKMNESQDGVPEGMMRVTGVAAVIGTKNRNNRIYTEQNYLYWVDKLQDQIKAGRLFGELEHPDSDNINNNNVSHKIEALWYEPKTHRVMITLLLLDTEKGKIAQSIIRAGGAISVSSRANGSVNQAGIATIDDLITYDIVGTPGFAESELYLSESVKRNNLARFKSSPLSECMMFVPNSIHNRTSLREALSNTYFQNSNKIFMKSQKRNLAESVRSAKRILESRRRGNGLAAARLTEAQASQVQNWVINDYTPMLLKYLGKGGMIRMNESMTERLMSFGAYASRIMNWNKLHEAEGDENDPNECNENEEPENGEQVLEPNDAMKDQVHAVELKERWERKANRLARKIREAEEDKKEAEKDGDDEKAAEIQETIDDLKDEQDDLKEKIEDIEKKIDEAKNGRKRNPLMERLTRKANRLARKIREAEEEKKDAEEDGDDKKAAEIQEEIEDLQEEQEEVADKIEELKKECNESRRRSRRMRESEEGEETLPQTLTDEELDQLSDDELDEYIARNENAATDNEEPEVLAEDDDDDDDDNEPKTPGEAEEQNECGDNEPSPFMSEDDDPNAGEETNNECGDPAMQECGDNELPEEVESPFITEAKRRVRAQSQLVESIRRRTAKKNLR